MSKKYEAMSNEYGTITFEWYLKEHCRYGWLSPHNTPETLKEKYFNSYLEYCKGHNLKTD